MHTHFDPRINITVLVIVLAVIIYKIKDRIQPFLYSRQCKNWPKTKGKITLTPNTDDSSEKSRVIASIRSGSTISLEYEYEVNGVSYEGDNISFKLSGVKNEVLAKRLAEEYERGQEVDVYYHPKKPAISVLNVN